MEFLKQGKSGLKKPRFTARTTPAAETSSQEIRRGKEKRRAAIRAEHLLIKRRAGRDRKSSEEEKRTWSSCEGRLTFVFWRRA